MARFLRILAGPVGPFLICFAVLLGLFILPGNDEAILIGSAAGNLTDPAITIIALVTALAARRWWHVCIGAAMASLWIALRPRSEYFPYDPVWHVVSAIAAFLAVVIVAGLVGGAITLFRHRTSNKARHERS